MTLAPTLGDALSAALLFLVSLLMMSAVVALVWRLLRPAIEAWAPAARLRITSALLVMPGIAAAVLAIWSAAPHWWSQVLGHCALHRPLTPISRCRRSSPCHLDMHQSP